MAEQVLAGQRLAVDERAEPRATIRQDVRTVFEHDPRVLARDVPSGHLQVGRRAAADGELWFVDRNGALSLNIGNAQTWCGHAGFAFSTPVWTRTPVKSYTRRSRTISP